MEVVACRTWKINTVFIVVVVVLVPKYIYVQYLYEQANAGIAMWKLWRVGFEKNTIFTAAVPLRFPKNLYQVDFSSLLDNQLV